jgi:hypothetical protein
MQTVFTAIRSIRVPSYQTKRGVEERRLLITLRLCSKNNPLLWRNKSAKKISPMATRRQKSLNLIAKCGDSSA